MRQAILIVGAIVLLGFLVFGMRGGDEGVPVESDQAVTGTVDDSMDKAGAEADAAAESAGRTLEQAADDAAAAGREAMDKAGEAADDAMAAISDAAGKAADTVKGAADAVGETAKDAMASAEGAMDNAGATAGDAMHSASETGAEVARMTDEQLHELFTVEGFDYDKAVAYIEQSDLGFAAKEATKSALASVKDAPDQLAAVLEEARDRLGL
ncbi:hypothetical protein LCM08_23295 [Salipiger pacificus]|uniref:Translation initiation factor 3 n=1 Tax=Alloyangia mangrovi TaxID=1779329 RepID=A0A2A3JYH7_9RHOB|nr:hypothetical protein [Alloyangia pacifica]MCA0947863.1 hypothetical protein [Alloyangia pacifica]